MVSLQITERESCKLEKHLKILENLHPTLKMSKNSFISSALEEFLENDAPPKKKQIILRLPADLKRKITEKLAQLRTIDKNYTLTQFVLDAIHNKIEDQKSTIDKILKS